MSGAAEGRVPRVRRIVADDPSTWRAVAQEAAAALAGGEVVILPAEGLYGFHARADLPAAVEALRALKPRETRQGWIVVVPDRETLEGAGIALEPMERALVSAHWPGALTIVMRGGGRLPAPARAEDGSVAVRCPGNAFLRAVLREAGGWVVSTSANRPGAPPPSTLPDVEGFGDLLAVDAGPLSGAPSTLVRVDGGAVTILRQGAVSIAPAGAAPDGP